MEYWTRRIISNLYLSPFLPYYLGLKYSVLFFSSSFFIFLNLRCYMHNFKNSQRNSNGDSFYRIDWCHLKVCENSLENLKPGLWITFLNSPKLLTSIYWMLNKRGVLDQSNPVQKPKPSKANIYCTHLWTQHRLNWNHKLMGHYLISEEQGTQTQSLWLSLNLPQTQGSSSGLQMRLVRP